MVDVHVVPEAVAESLAQMLHGDLAFSSLLTPILIPQPHPELWPLPVVDVHVVPEAVAESLVVGLPVLLELGPVGLCLGLEQPQTLRYGRAGSRHEKLSELSLTLFPIMLLVGATIRTGQMSLPVHPGRELSHPRPAKARRQRPGYLPVLRILQQPSHLVVPSELGCDAHGRARDGRRLVLEIRDLLGPWLDSRAMAIVVGDGGVEASGPAVLRVRLPNPERPAGVEHLDLPHVTPVERHAACRPTYRPRVTPAGLDSVTPP